MELSVMNNEDKNHPKIDKLVEKPQAGATYELSPQADADGQAALRGYNYNDRITESARWRCVDRPDRQKHHIQRNYTGPTWSHLLRQIILGLIEIMIPLAFIIGMAYWRAPWLFWAVVHFLKGEPILNF